MKNGWPVKPMGEVCANLDSKRIPITKNKRVAGQYPDYGASGVVDQVDEDIFDEELLLVSEDGANLLARMLGLDGQNRSRVIWYLHAKHLREMLRWFRKIRRFVWANGLFWFGQKIDIFNASFLAFLLLESKTQAKLLAHSRGVTVQHVNMKDIRALDVGAIPSVKLQQSIVSTLWDLDEETQRLKSIYQRKLAALDELKKSLLHKAFSGQLWFLIREIRGQKMFFTTDCMDDTVKHKKAIPFMSTKTRRIRRSEKITSAQGLQRETMTILQ